MMIGEVIRSWRQKRDIGVRQLAKELGVSHGTVSRIERGEQVDAVTLLKLVMWLFDGRMIVGPVSGTRKERVK